MISEKQAKKYCNEDPSLIENYWDAMNDETQLWHCHHRLEIQPNGVKVSRNELLRSGMYYNRPANQLIFLTETEHRRIHRVGKFLSEDTKRKLSEANKGRQSPNKGKTFSEETRRKMSIARQYISDDTRRKLSEANKGRKQSEETKRKISEAQKRRCLHEEIRRKISEAHKGKIVSEETRRKISEARRAYWEKRKNAEATNILED